MRRASILIALGVGAYLAFVLTTLPASIVASQIESHGLTAVSSSGTVWEGRLLGLRSGTTPLGDVSWQLQPSKLLLGTLAAHVELARPDGFARGRLAAQLGGDLQVSDADLALPLAALAAVGAPAGWQGSLHANVDGLTLAEGWIVAMQGQVEARDLVGPARNPARMGGFRVVFPAAIGPAHTPGMLVGELDDLGDGPLDVTGTIALSRDRSYRIEGWVAARSTAPQGVVDTLRFLGPPDAAGRRPFTIEGTL